MIEMKNAKIISVGRMKLTILEWIVILFCFFNFVLILQKRFDTFSMLLVGLLSIVIAFLIYYDEKIQGGNKNENRT